MDYKVMIKKLRNKMFLSQLELVDLLGDEDVVITLLLEE
mgnify:CR=1 FL=1